MNAKSLITGQVNEADEAGAPPTPPTGGGFKRPGGGFKRPGGAAPAGAPGAPGAPAEPAALNPKEQAALKDLVLLNLLTAFVGGDTFYTDLVNAALEGKMPDRAQCKHFLDEAGKFAKRLGPEHNELMNKIAAAA